jgi:5-(carboxyamino)imidazole ribonucleotide synthase
MKMILPGSTIGIIGGGQLGRMMALSAKAMGFHIAVLDPQKNSPAAQIADIEIVAPYHDLEAAKQLAKISDIITYEFENVDFAVLEWLEINAYLPQGSELIKVTQDRLREKQTIQKSGSMVVPFHAVDNQEALKEAITFIGYPAVLKTRSGGYDGRGQVIIRHPNELEEACRLLQLGPCILEKFIEFEKEISVIVHRSIWGEVTTFPVAENVHVHHILQKTIVPANLSTELVNEAKNVAIQLAEKMKMIGTLGVEMFVTKNNEIYINELAPRPHNSGHYTMDACCTSQFEQHIRAICNWPLSSTKLFSPVVMMNILGQHVEGVLRHIDKIDFGKVHLYGKDKVKENRKMGHINFIGDDVPSILSKIDALEIW